MSTGFNSMDNAWCTCSTAAATAAKTATCAGFNLVPGKIVIVKYTVTNTAANPTLNVNNSGAYPIYYRGSAIGKDYLAANRTHIYIFNGSQYDYIGDINTDANNIDRLQHNGAIKATSAITNGNIIVDTGSGYEHLKSNKAFYVDRPILYAGSNINASATGTNNFISIHFTVTTTQSITLTAYKPVYIRGKLESNKFTPISATPLIQDPVSNTLGTYDDYMLLGMATANNNVYLLPEHQIFTYDGTALYPKTSPCIKSGLYNAIYIANGAAGYYKAAQIQIKKTYADKPISFEFIRRVESFPTKVEIQFNSGNTSDPTIKFFRTSGPCNEVYLKKSDTSVWDLYIQKQQAYDSMTILNYMNPYDSYGQTVVVNWLNPFSASADAISGWTQATKNSLITASTMAIGGGDPTSYAKIDMDGKYLLMCWGVCNKVESTNSSRTATITFPKSFSKVPTIMLTPGGNSLRNHTQTYSVQSATTTNFVMSYPGQTLFEYSVAVFWFAIGESTTI